MFSELSLAVHQQWRLIVNYKSNIKFLIAWCLLFSCCWVVSTKQGYTVITSLVLHCTRTYNYAGTSQDACWFLSRALRWDQEVLQSAQHEQSLNQLCSPPATPQLLGGSFHLKASCVMELKKSTTSKHSFKRCPPSQTCQGSVLDGHY